MCVCVCVCQRSDILLSSSYSYSVSPLSFSLLPPLSPTLSLPSFFSLLSFSSLLSLSFTPPLPLLPRRCRHKPELAKKLYLMALKVRPNDPMVRRNYALLLRDCPELRSGHSRIISVPVRKQRTGSRRPPPRGPPGGGGSGSPSSSKTFGSLGR